MRNPLEIGQRILEIVRSHAAKSPIDHPPKSVHLEHLADDAIGGGNTVAIEDEGVAKGAASTIDFVGAGVTAGAVAGGQTTVTIPGGGAPTDADYLVGTANPSLSAEIVVGTTPGGELGGTWGSPTVDATHSGSPHITTTTDGEHAIAGADIAGVDAGAAQSGHVSTGTQTLAGLKTFSTGIAVNDIAERTAASGVTVDGLLIKDGAIDAAFRLAKDTVTIDANDEIALPSHPWVYVTCAGASDNLDGIVQGASDGHLLFLRPAIGKDITLVHDGTVTAGKKLMINGEANVVMDQDHDIAIAIYDATATVWNVLVPGSGGAGGDVATDAIWDALGDLLYGTGANTGAKLAGQITTTRKFLRQVGDGAVSAAPAWDTLVAADVPDVSATYVPKAIVDAAGDLIIGTAADTVARLAIGATEGQFLRVAGSTAAWESLSFQFSGWVPGQLAAGTPSKKPTICTRVPGVITEVWAHVDTAPTGAALIIQFRKAADFLTTSPSYGSGTLIEELTVAIDAEGATSTSLDTTAIAASDLFWIDVIQVGSTVAGSDLTWGIVWRPT